MSDTSFKKYCHSCGCEHGFTCRKNAEAERLDEKNGNGPIDITGTPTPETSRYIMPHVSSCTNVKIQCKDCGLSETKLRPDLIGFMCTRCTGKSKSQFD